MLIILKDESQPLYEPLPQLSASEANEDDIKTEYHPNSNIPETIKPFEEFGFRKLAEHKPPQNFYPWRPFRTRLDFEVAEFSLNAGLSENLTSSLIGLLEKCSQHKDNFTVKSSKELNELWNIASVKNLNVCESISE